MVETPIEKSHDLDENNHGDGDDNENNGDDDDDDGICLLGLEVFPSENPFEIEFEKKTSFLSIRVEFSIPFSFSHLSALSDPFQTTHLHDSVTLKQRRSDTRKWTVHSRKRRHPTRKRHSSSKERRSLLKKRGSSKKRKMLKARH